MTKKAIHREYGDFQTPQPLAEAIMAVLCRLGINPKTILEPTCGKGAFLIAALNTFPEVTRCIGFDINKHHLEELKCRVSSFTQRDSLEIIHGDFFSFDWNTLLCEVPEPVLIIGNPPWVTNSELGVLGSENLPKKVNSYNRSGYEAITGKSNFDLSEWMLLEYLNWLRGRGGVIAVLCKTSVARKTLLHIWKHQFTMCDAKMFLIDARKHFNVSVDACLLVIDVSAKITSFKCALFNDFNFVFISNRNF
jgi:type I restriction-modification system DNA methylase subunit